MYQTIINGIKTTFLYDGDALVAEYDAANNLTKRYVHGDQVDEPWVQYESAAIGNGNWRYIHADHQGSVIALSTSSGNLSGAALSYDTYGIPKTTNASRFGYTGQAWLKELGLFHYKARVYNPKLGRFLQTDPIFYKDQMNLYAYVGNDPVNNTDPTGTTCFAMTNGIGSVCAGMAALSSLNKQEVAKNIAASAASTAADFMPVVGDVKGIVEAVKEPTKANIAAAAVGVVPGLGDIAGKAIKIGGNRIGDFTRSDKNLAKATNAAANGGQIRCVDCGKALQSIQSQKGVTTPTNQIQIHHNPAIKDGGGRHSEAVVLCPPCHIERHLNENE